MDAQNILAVPVAAIAASQHDAAIMIAINLNIHFHELTQCLPTDNVNCSLSILSVDISKASFEST